MNFRTVDIENGPVRGEIRYHWGPNNDSHIVFIYIGGTLFPDNYKVFGDYVKAENWLLDTIEHADWCVLQFG
jgi:hypothetical protein